MLLNKGKFDESGFTLIEMVLAITIIGFAFTGIAALFTGIILTRNANDKLLQATSIAQNKMEFYRNQSYSYIRDTLPSTTTEPNGLFTINTTKESDGDGYVVDITVTWDESLRNQNKTRTYSIVSFFAEDGLNDYINTEE
jgi:prepilin-type N-terminal cleavage/methylation domain-containing protein